MEKVSFKNSSGLELAGVLHAPKKDTTAGVIIAHSFTSNKDRDRLVKIATALADSGIAALRFDFAGSGESADRPVTIAAEIEDLKSAISYLRQRNYRHLGLLGESLGGFIALACYTSNIEAMVLWSPVTKATEPNFVKKERRQQEIKEKGFVVYHKDGKDFKIPQQYFDERSTIDRKKILENVKIPVLIFHGDLDSTLPLKDSKEALNFLPKGSVLEIIKGEGHKLDNPANELIPKTVNWYLVHLK